MLDLRLDLGIDDILKRLDDLERRHVPFALAQALNATAFAAQREVRAQMPDRFTLRRPWTPRGVRVGKASKRDLTARVFTADWYMETQETGGTRPPAL